MGNGEESITFNLIEDAKLSRDWGALSNGGNLKVFSLFARATGGNNAGMGTLIDLLFLHNFLSFGKLALFVF